MFSCVFTLIGVIYLLNFIPDYKIEINAVSVVNLVMSCGLSVEFTVHLIIFYLRSPHTDARAKMKYVRNIINAGPKKRWSFCVSRNCHHKDYRSVSTALCTFKDLPNLLFQNVFLFDHYRVLPRVYVTPDFPDCVQLWKFA